jgi:hypothetical protein
MSTQVDIKNYWKEEDCLFLLDHEEVCPHCKGHGITAAFDAEKLMLKAGELEIIAIGEKPSLDAVALVFCNVCEGEGKLDWIRRIRGTEFHQNL